MKHPNCVCGEKGIWKYTCGCGYICICKCHKKELEK